jgi:hypothetical protein
MKELTEIRFNDNRLLLKDNRVKSSILPSLANELDRDVVIQGNCVIDGAIYGRTIEVQQGNLQVDGAVFSQVECHVNSDAKGTFLFKKAVGSAGSIVSLGAGAQPYFLGDLSARQIHLRNAYVSASLYGDDIVLEDCVVIGGVFGTKSVDLSNCVVGTFNSPVVKMSKTNYLLFPSAFSVEKLNALPGTELWNLTLADLGAHMQGVTSAAGSGKIPIDVTKDEVKAVLTGDGAQQTLRSYSVVGKVLAADLQDFDNLRNHFLITCASLGSQLLQTYELGVDAQGQAVSLTPERIARFFSELIQGKITIPVLSRSIDIETIVRGERFNFVPAAKPEEVNENPATPEAIEQPEPSPITAEPVPDSAPVSFATDTGPVVVEAERCKHCGEVVESGSAFCDNCGRAQR